MNKGAMGKLVQLIITAIAVFSLIALSLWSLRNTIEFTALASTDGATWATLAGLVIQFGPNVFSYLARNDDDGNKKLLWRSLFWVFTIVDAGTNVGKGLSLDRPIDITNEAAYQLARWMRLFFDVAVVFSEEGIEHFVSVFFDQVADLVDILGGHAPGWLRMANSFAGGNNRPQSKSQHNNSGNQSNRNQSQQNNRNQGNGRDTHLPLARDFPIEQDRHPLDRNR